MTIRIKRFMPEKRNLLVLRRENTGPVPDFKQMILDSRGTIDKAVEFAAIDLLIGREFKVPTVKANKPLIAAKIPARRVLRSSGEVRIALQHAEKLENGFRNLGD